MSDCGLTLAPEVIDLTVSGGCNPDLSVSVVEQAVTLAATPTSLAVTQQDLALNLTQENLALSVTTLGAQGPKGDPGVPGSSLVLTRPAAQALGGDRLVWELPDGTVDYADPTATATVQCPVWLTLTSAAAGADVDCLVRGDHTEPSWSWAPGPLYLAVGGLLTQTPPAYPSFLRIVAYAVTSTSIVFDQHTPIALGA